MNEVEKIKSQFLKFTGKGLDELTTKEEDFLLELWREENQIVDDYLDGAYDRKKEEMEE